MFDASQDLVSNPEDIGSSDEAGVIAHVLPLAGLQVVDIGCGGGRVARQLVAQGARVLGVEPDPVQAARNREADPLTGLTFAEAPGQALPLEDASVDLAVFSFSLHHVPADLMPAALTEARRVLRPSGTLCILEPLISGSFEAAYRPFHDERSVRRLAYAALAEHAEPFFGQARELMWSDETNYGSFEDFVSENVSTTHTNFHREHIDTPEVRARFEEGRRGDGYVFTSYGRANIYRDPVAVRS